MDEVNAAIAANADNEELVDQPRVVKGIVRVSGPFTMEAVMPAEWKGDEVGFGGAPDEEGLETFGSGSWRVMRVIRTEPGDNLAHLDAIASGFHGFGPSGGARVSPYNYRFMR